jgi:hypothetical protein
VEAELTRFTLSRHNCHAGERPDRGVPVGIEHHHLVGRGQVQPQPACVSTPSVSESRVTFPRVRTVHKCTMWKPRRFTSLGGDEEEEHGRVVVELVHQVLSLRAWCGPIQPLVDVVAAPPQFSPSEGMRGCYTKIGKRLFSSRWWEKGCVPDALDRLLDDVQHHGGIREDQHLV